MNKRFSIGEMAKLHNLSIKTLRYYDEINLFNPSYVDENSGYRYYITEQFERLNTIQYLKKLGFSLKEIKDYLEHRDIDKFLHLLVEQKKLTEKKIRELERINLRHEKRIQDIVSAKKIRNLDEPIIVKLSQRKILQLVRRINTEEELELSLRQLESLSGLNGSIFIGGVGLTVDKDNLKQHKFNEYNSIFIIDEETIHYQPLAAFPEGLYACIFYNGNHDNSAKYYEKLLQYIDKNKYKIIGDSIERTIIDHYVSGNECDDLTEIQIPIKKS
jgi:effector-binding domain-containing protein